MQKLPIVLCAALMAAAGTAAQAEIIYTPQDPATYDFGIGLYNPADPCTLNSVFVTSASGGGAFTSDYFTFTFAAHMDAIYYAAQSLHFSFGYDNDSIEVIGAWPMGGWYFNNYSGMTWPNPSGGWISVTSLTQSMGTGTSCVYMGTSAVVPFFQVMLHVKDAQTSHINGFGISAMTLVSHLYAITLFPPDFKYFSGAIHEVPEPASMTLLLGGVAGLAGRAVRRRRRAA